jgi:hypothetical protein
MDATKLDGVTIDMDGPLRAEQLDNRWYAVGRGMLIPCRDRAEAEEVAEEFTRGL